MQWELPLVMRLLMKFIRFLCLGGQDDSRLYVSTHWEAFWALLFFSWRFIFVGKTRIVSANSVAVREKVIDIFTGFDIIKIVFSLKKAVCNNDNLDYLTTGGVLYE